MEDVLIKLSPFYNKGITSKYNTVIKPNKHIDEICSYLRSIISSPTIHSTDNEFVLKSLNAIDDRFNDTVVINSLQELIRFTNVEMSIMETKKIIYNGYAGALTKYPYTKNSKGKYVVNYRIDYISSVKEHSLVVGDAAKLFTYSHYNRLVQSSNLYPLLTLMQTYYISSEWVFKTVSTYLPFMFKSLEESKLIERFLNRVYDELGYTIKLENDTYSYVLTYGRHFEPIKVVGSMIDGSVSYSFLESITEASDDICYEVSGALLAIIKTSFWKEFNQ